MTQIFRTDSPAILQRQLGEFASTVAAELQRLQRELRPRNRHVRIFASDTVQAQAYDVIECRPQVATDVIKVYVPMPSEALRGASLVVMHQGSVGKVQVLARSGTVSGRSSILLPPQSALPLESNGQGWWTISQGSYPLESQGALAEFRRQNCDLGYVTEFDNTEVYTGSRRSPQGIDWYRDGENERIVMTQRVSGSTWAVNETARVVIFPYSNAPGDVAPLEWSEELNIGHGQDVSAYVENGQLWLFTTMTTESGHTGADAGRGYSKIRWNGVDTEQADVTNYQLIGYAGSGHILERFYNCTACVSADGTKVILFANNTEDTMKYCLIWDRALVEAAADPLDVLPLAIWAATSTFQGAESQILQGVAANDRYIYTVQGYYNPLGWVYLNQHDYEGNLIRSCRLTGPREQYGIDALLAGNQHAVSDMPTQFEPEGLALRDDELLVCWAEEWRDTPDAVTFDGEGYSAVATSTGEEPNQTRSWMRTSRTGMVAWNAGSTYDDGDYATYVSKTLYGIRVARGDADELPLSAGLYTPKSGASVVLGNNVVDVSYPIGQSLQIKRFNEQTGEYLNSFEIHKTGFRAYDGSTGSDNTHYNSYTADFTGGRELCQIRVKGTVTAGAGINLYGEYDSESPFSIRFFNNSYGEHSHQFDADSRILLDGKNTGVRTSWAQESYNATGGRRIYQLRGDRTLTYGAGINLYGVDDSTYPGAVALYSTNGHWTVDGPTGGFFALSGSKEIGGPYNRIKGLYAGTVASNAFRLMDWAGDTSKYGALGQNTSSGRVIAEIRADRELAYGAGLNLYGTTDSTYPGALRIFIGSNVNCWTFDGTTGAFVCGSGGAADIGGSANRVGGVYGASAYFKYYNVKDWGGSSSYYGVISQNSSSGRVILQIRGDRSNSYGPGINLYGSNDSTYPDQLHIFLENEARWRFVGLDLLPTASGAQNLGSSSYPLTQLHARIPIVHPSADASPSATNNLYVSGGHHKITNGGSNNIRRIYWDGGTPFDGQRLLLKFASGLSPAITIQYGYATGGNNVRSPLGSYTATYTGGEIVELIWNDEITEWVVPE